MVKRNHNFERLEANYLFKRMLDIAAKYKDVVDLSIGDTSLPIPKEVTEAMERKAQALGTLAGYTGYGMGQGNVELRELIAKKYGRSADEVFISDGAKSDIGRLQLLFGNQVSIAVQDPAYPVYVDTSLLMGQKEIVYLPCTRENNFFPQLKKADLIYFCSPHNPTGYAATKDQLTELVEFAKKYSSIIIYDSAYAAFIQNPDCPSSIYEIPGADEVAIEVSSFSKTFGFTGVRLGWSIVPKQLKYADGGLVHPDYLRIATTFFNGASNIAQAGGVAAMQTDCSPLIAHYRENARILSEALKEQFVVGGGDAPYLFVYFGGNSWQEFETLLERSGVLAIPGSGFGRSGEGFLRFSALAKRSTIEEAANRLHCYLSPTC